MSTPVSTLDSFRLEKKFAVVTGGGRGIGRAIAQTFASAGAHVHILDLDPVLAGEVAKEIAASGGKASFSICDVTNSEKVSTAFAEIGKQAPIDILVNSAGIAHVGTLETTTVADFENVLRVNVHGVFHCMQAVIGGMKGRGGVILNIASIAATTGLADRFAYSTTKGAVLSMTLSVAKDYLQHKIRCNCISPARVHTPFVDGFVKKNYPGREQEIYGKLAASQPIGRMGKPEEVASLALYLCSDAASFVTGVDYPLDGGYFNLRG